MARRRFFARASGIREIFRGAAALLIVALIIRIMLLLGASAKVEELLRAAAADSAFVKATLDFELRGASVIMSDEPGGWERLIMWESAVMSARFPAVDAPALTVTEDDNMSHTVPENIPGTVESAPADSETGPPPETLMVNTAPSGGDNQSGVYINNETSFNIDIDKFINEKLDISLARDEAQVLIVHTHGSESYYPDEEYYYVPTDNSRTEDTEFNVVRIGDEVASILEANGIKTVHDRGIYDYPTYSGSYTRTLEVIEDYLEKYPSIKIVLDIHRDYLSKSDGTVYKLMTNIDGDDTAQIMLVMGTSQGGLPHPEWEKNLRLGIHIQKAMADKYPTLARPLNLRRERFNQHATTGSMIVEMGCSGNTLGEALTAARLFAECVSGVLEEYKN